VDCLEVDVQTEWASKMEVNTQTEAPLTIEAGTFTDAPARAEADVQTDAVSSQAQSPPRSADVQTDLPAKAEAQVQTERRKEEPIEVDADTSSDEESETSKETSVVKQPPAARKVESKKVNDTYQMMKSFAPMGSLLGVSLQMASQPRPLTKEYVYIHEQEQKSMDALKKEKREKREEEPLTETEFGTEYSVESDSEKDDEASKIINTDGAFSQPPSTSPRSNQRASYTSGTYNWMRVTVPVGSLLGASMQAVW